MNTQQNKGEVGTSSPPKKYTGVKSTDRKRDSRKRFERHFEKEFKQVPRIYDRNASDNPADYKEMEPDRYHGCKNWTWWQDTETHIRHKRACNRCRDCRNYKHERICGQAIAQANVSSVVMGLTLTYADIDGETPDAAKRLNYSDVEKMLKRMRKAGYRFSKISAGEYGGKDARAHWHLVLFFEWDSETHQRIITAIENNQSYDKIGHETQWRKLAPAHVANLRGQSFRDAIADPETLVVSYPQSRRQTKLGTAHIRNTAWKFWQHGIVEAQIAKSPDYSNEEDIEGAIRYPMKYLSKDAWRDSRKYKTTPFDQLPEHIRQQTRFGPWKTQEEIDAEWDADAAQGKYKTVFSGQRLTGQDHRKWRYGNDYFKKLEKELIAKYGSDEEEIPVEERLYKGRYNYKAKGGLGAAYFKALGVQTSRLNWKEEHMRGYKIGANYADKQPSMGMKEIGTAGGARVFLNADGKVVTSTRQRFAYVMSNANYRRFWEGYNAEQRRQQKPETAGPDDAVIELQTQAAIASDASTGAFGYHWWKKASVSSRETMVTSTGWMPEEDLRGLFPKRWINLQMDTSTNLGWQAKRVQRDMREILSDIKIYGAPDPWTVHRLLHYAESLAEQTQRTLAAMPQTSKSSDPEKVKRFKADKAFREERAQRIIWPVIKDARNLSRKWLALYTQTVDPKPPELVDDLYDWIPPTNVRKLVGTPRSKLEPEKEHFLQDRRSWLDD